MPVLLYLSGAVNPAIGGIAFLDLDQISTDFKIEYF